MSCDLAKWPSTTSVAQLLSEGVLVIGDGYRAKNSELASEGLPFARAANVRGAINVNGAELLSFETVQRAGDKISKPGDAVFTSKGTVGRFAFVGAADPTVVYSPQVCYWRSLDHKVVDPRFLFYWLHGAECRLQFDALKGQTDMADYISLRDQRGITISLPPIDEQLRIAAVLGALDSKIAACAHITENLERLAAAAFDAAMLGATEQTTLGALGTIAGGGTPKSGVPEYWDPAEVAWLTPTDMTALEVPVVLDTRRAISELGLAKSSAKLVPVGTVLMTSRATVGLTAIAGVPLCTNQGFITVQPASGLSAPLVLFAVRSVMALVHSLAGGSTFPEINKTNFKGIEAWIPAAAARERFDNAALPIFELITEQTHAIARLRGLRDELLPKLVIGKLRVAGDYLADAAQGAVG